MKIYKISILMIGIISIMGLSSCSEDNTTTPGLQEYIADDNSFSDFMSWTLEATNSGPDPALGMAHAGNDSSVTRKIYVKNGQNRVNGKFPVGTIVLKHSSNPSGAVNQFTAMVKRGNNFNPSGNDWEWFMLTPEGNIATDNGTALRGANLLDGMCVGCHSAASSKDFVFSK